MFKSLFKKSPTSKFDVAIALGAAFIAAWKAVDTVKDYKSEQENQENTQ